MITQATLGQIKQINRFGSDAIDKVLDGHSLDNPGAQRVIEHGDEFAHAIRTAALASLKDLSIWGKFKDEEVESIHGYLSGYKSNRSASIDLIIADFEQQVVQLDLLFNCGRSFNSDWIVRTHRLCPTWLEKFFAQLDWRLIAFTYNEAVEKVLAIVKKTLGGNFNNCLEGQFGPDRLRQYEKKH